MLTVVHFQLIEYFLKVCILKVCMHLLHRNSTRKSFQKVLYIRFQCSCYFIWLFQKTSLIHKAIHTSKPKSGNTFLPRNFFLMSKNYERTLLPRLFPSPTHVVAVSSLWSAFQGKVREPQLSEKPETVKLKLASLCGLSDQFLKGELASSSSLS